ncbi:TlpA family protein disulfide reductase [Dyella solisilvae]|uniref:TlpA family protein disulfide reductase n=1 Tax=Dyella solisilvae TaxID=1920168 RepID=A0A370K889_9GAMM|nr:TlpA disulfide reductase family protein [Dyella solisilvae]RDI98637.1 TlpA family protein disulfide reductase [Dyella solisilvae]
MRIARLLALTFVTCATTVHAQPQDFTLPDPSQLGVTANVRYLDAAGRPLDYVSFMRQVNDGNRYASTRDAQTGAAMLRIAGPAPGHHGIRMAFGRGDAFPPFELPALNGELHRLGDYGGRYTLVSFFFAECAPCIAEAPMLSAYAREHDDMNFVAITYEDAASAKRFAKERNLDWPILHDGQGLIDVLGVSVYPTLMLVGPDGRIAGAAVGIAMRDDPTKRLADLTGWIEQWKQSAAARQPDAPH